MRLAQAGDQVAYATLLVLLTSTTRQFARARLGAVQLVGHLLPVALPSVWGAIVGRRWLNWLSHR